jgi:hypothetical protein
MAGLGGAIAPKDLAMKGSKLAYELRASLNSLPQVAAILGYNLIP